MCSKPLLNASNSIPVLSNKQDALPAEEANTKSMPQLPCRGDGSSKAKGE
jgi:hypothetical protein